MSGLSPRFAAVAVFLAVVALSGAELSAQADTTNTRSGVFTAVQAAKGKEIHGAACLSCHKPIEHADPRFFNGLVGKPLAEFFGYLRVNMPQDNPGSLADDDYASVIAFILQLNAMPAGEKPLPGDSSALAKVRVSPLDSTRKGPGK